MGAEQYLGFFYGNKEEAISNLEKWIPLYENSPNKHSPKVTKRIADYKELLSAIKAVNDE